MQRIRQDDLKHRHSPECHSWFLQIDSKPNAKSLRLQTAERYFPIHGRVRQAQSHCRADALCPTSKPIQPTIQVKLLGSLLDICQPQTGAKSSSTSMLLHQ